MIRKLTKIITVKELISFLSELPDDAIVKFEGCDCENYCDGINYDRDYNTVLLTINSIFEDYIWTK